MAKAHELVVHKSLISWITSKNKWLQFLLVVTAMIAVLANVLPLEMQKRIVNDAINLRKFDLLVLYCGIYLVAVIAASILKYLINVLQTIIGQRTLSDMRQALYAHILTMPLSFYRKTQPGLVVAALTTELATAGDFVGMAIAVPVTNLLMLFAFAGYLFWLNPLLAAVTLSIYPVVLLLVPMLQKRVNTYNRKRVDAGRKVSGKVGESVAGIHEIQANGAFRIENKKFNNLVANLRKIRIIWNLYRFAVKAVNSLFTNFSRFLVFALGGYLAINGRLELGALVAFLSAQEKLYDPWKELIQFYQAYQTASVTYSRTMEYFDVAPEHSLAPEGRRPHELEGSIEVIDLSFVVEDGTRLLSEINFNLKHGEHMALVGFSGSGKSTLAQCIAQLYKYSSGKILIDQKEVSQLSKKDIIYNIGFVSQTPFITTCRKIKFSFEFLAKAKLSEPLLNLGVAFIEELIKRLDHRSSDEKILGLGLIDPEEIDDYKRLLYKVKKKGIPKVSSKGRNKILQLMLNFIPQKHRFLRLPKKLENRILDGRALFKKKISTTVPSAISFYRMSKYMHAQSILTNIFFGNLKEECPAAQEKVNTCIHQLLIREDFLEDIIKMGMQHSVGTKGDNLSGGQRQKLAIARMFIKKPTVMIMDEATSGLDNESQARIQDLLETQWKGKSTLIAVVHRLDIIKNYDRVAVMKGGKIIEMGTYDELMEKHGVLRELVDGKK